jgi:hypothetical protein
MILIRVALLVMMILAILSTTGFGKLSVGVSCGDGSSDMRSTVTYGEDTISASQNLIADPKVGISNHFNFQGSLPGVTSSYTDSQGNYVYLYRMVSGISSTTGSWDWAITKGSSPLGWAQGELWLNVNNAKLIYAESSAANREGDKAKSTATISSVSAISNLVNYYAKAYADPSIVSSAQSAGSAKGDTINFDTYATNKEKDMAETYTSGTAGVVKSYSAKAYSKWYEAYAELDKSMLADVPTGSITQKMYAEKYDQASPSYMDKSESKDYLKSGSMQTKSSNAAGYIDKAYASKYYDRTYAYSSADFNLNANGVAYSFASALNNPIGGSLSQTLYAPYGFSRFNAFGWTGPGPVKNMQVVWL